MNFYPHHISDFNNSTRHLTRVERSVYRDAIEHYYDTESVLTNNFDKLSKRLLCFAEEEKKALFDVLEEFFELTDDGYFHVRCDEEIAKYRRNIGAKARAGIASAEARRKKATDRKQKSTRVKTRSTGVRNQEPLTINQEPLSKTLDQSAIDRERMFDQFWASGIRKVNKKKAFPLFNNLLKKQPDAASFTTKLVLDVKARLNSNQLGFAEMHPTTYLNGERWNDEIQQGQKVEPRKSTFENLTDRSWADGMTGAQTLEHIA